MILLTRLNGSTFAVNPDLIERVQESPDTSVVLVDGTTYIVTEPLGQVIDQIAGYRARVLALAHAMQFDEPAPVAAAGRFGVVRAAQPARGSADAALRHGRS